MGKRTNGENQRRRWKLVTLLAALLLLLPLIYFLHVLPVLGFVHDDAEEKTSSLVFHTITLSNNSSTAATTKIKTKVTNTTAAVIDVNMLSPNPSAAKTFEEGTKQPVDICKRSDDLFSRDFSKGGIIIFFHVPKTGGSSIQEHIRKMNKVDYNFNLIPRHYNETALFLDSLTQRGTDTRTLFVEFHGNCPPLAKVQDDMDRWRKQASQSRIPFVAFTILRDPVPWSISAFNDMCLVRNKCGTHEATVEGMLRRQNPNMQCRFFSTGWEGWTARPDLDPTVNDCREATKVMERHLDYVGKLERFNETLCFLQSVLPGRNFDDFNEVVTATNQIKRRYIRKEELNSTAIKFIHDISHLDYDLYNKEFHHFQ